MAAFINTNTASLNAQRNLTTSQSSLTTSLQRLSSGLRINSAKDDAAGLAISERFTTQIRGISQAARNANDGISLAQTAEGTLGEIGNNLQRMRELAVQSRNSTNSAEDRIALDTEVQQLKAEIGRVAGQANFNGTKLLDGSATNMTFQVGANQGETISIASIANANIDKLGTWETPDTAVATATVVPTGAAGAGATSGTGTLGIAGVTPPGAGTEIAASTISFDGGTTNINIGATTTGTAGTPADAQAEYLSNVAAAITTAVGNGTAPAGLSATYDATAKTITFANSATTAASLTGTAMTGTTAVTAGTAAGATSFSAIAAGELQINGKDVIVGAATTGAGRVDDLMAAINSQINDVVASKDTSGKLVLTSTSAIDVKGSKATAADSGLSVATTSVTASTAPTDGFANENVTTTANADRMILAMDAALKSVNSSRAGLGAVQNRFSSVIANLQTTSENLSASRSRIQDTDFAAETASLTRGQILQQAGTAMLAQANSLPNGVLSLLRG